MDPKQFRSIIREEVTDIVQTQLGPIKEDVIKLGKDVDNLNTDVKQLRVDITSLKKDVKEMSEDVGVLKKNVKEMNENVDAARGDIESLHMDVKAIKEKQGMYHSRNKREIDEIKTHLGMPLIPDTP